MPADCAGDCFKPNSPTTISVTLAPGGAGGDGALSYAARRRNLACRPPAQPLSTAHTKACRTTAPNQPADPAAAARTPTTPIPANTAISGRGDDLRPSPPLAGDATARGCPDPPPRPARARRRPPAARPPPDPPGRSS